MRHCHTNGVWRVVPTDKSQCQRQIAVDDWENLALVFGRSNGEAAANARLIAAAPELLTCVVLAQAYIPRSKIIIHENIIHVLTKAME